MAEDPLKKEGAPDYGTTGDSPEFSAKTAALGGHSDPERNSVSSDSDDSQNAPRGVKAIEAISKAWTGTWLIVAYLGVALLTSVQSLEQATTINVAPFATSSYNALGLLSAVGVVQSVLLSVVKPPMAKLSDVIGRLEALTVSVVLYVLGYIQQAASTSVESYAGALVFYSAGQTGVQILIQVFVADTTDLLWRAFFSTIPDVPFLWTTWVGPIIANDLGAQHWRWGYGIWAILLPITFMPLFVALLVNQLKAKRLGYYPISAYKGLSPWEFVKRLWFDLDFFGLLLIASFVSLILLPLTLGPLYGWDNPSYIAMFVVGGLCLLVFPFWERNRTLAPNAFFPRDIFRNRTALVGCTIAFFYFMAYYLSAFPYFQPYLQIVLHQSTTSAGHITQTFSFASTVTAICVSFLIRYTAHYKYFITLGAIVYTTGIGLMIVYRNEGASVATLIGCQLAIGIGGGMLNVPAQLGTQASVTHREVAAVTAVFLTVLEIGGAVGNAISGAIWSSGITSRLNTYLPPQNKHLAADIYGNLTLAKDYDRWPLGDPTRTAINQAYNETMHTILIVGVCIAALLIPLSLLMKNYKLNQIDQKVQGRVIGGRKETDGVPEVDRDETNEAPVNMMQRKRPIWKRRIFGNAK